MTRLVRAANGFTLIELMVSLVLFGLVATLLLDVLAGEHRAEAALDTRERALGEVIGVQGLLRGRIEALHSEPQPYDAGITLALRGSAHQFAFPAPLPAGSGPHALHYFRLTLAAPHRLVLETVSTLGGVNINDPSHQGWSATTLLDNVARLDIDYYGINPGSGQVTWQDDWSGRRTVPLLVRIAVAFAPGDPRRWPVLIVRPWPTARVKCDAGQTTGECGAQV